MTEYRKCPYCGEEILADAKKCKHCREWLDNPLSNQSLEKVETPINQRERFMDGRANSEQWDRINNSQPIVNVYTTTIQPKEQRKKNGIGLAGFILTFVSLVVSWAPGVNIALWILGTVFSIVGVFKRPKGFAIAGLVLSIITILIIILLAAVIGELLSELFDA